MFRMLLACYVLILVPWMIEAGTVTLEALCSSDRAGVRWTAHDIPLWPSLSEINEIDLSYSCINSNTGEELTDENEEVKCFHKNRGIPSLSLTRVRSMTHIVGRVLPSGTLCTFTADLESGYLDNLGSVTANCTVGAEDSVSLLPVQCTVSNDTQQCQCFCSPGFILSDHAVRTTDGTLCEEIAVTHSTQYQTSSVVINSSPDLEVAPTSTAIHMLLQRTSTRVDVIQSTVEIHSQTSRLSVIASNPMVTPISVVGTSSSHIQASPSSVANKTPATLNLQFQYFQRILTISSVTLVLVLVTLSSLVLVLLGKFTCWIFKNKVTLPHKETALQFASEKSNPDLNLVKVEKVAISNSQE